MIIALLVVSSISSADRGILLGFPSPLAWVTRKNLWNNDEDSEEREIKSQQTGTNDQPVELIEGDEDSFVVFEKAKDTKGNGLSYFEGSSFLHDACGGMIKDVPDVLNYLDIVAAVKAIDWRKEAEALGNEVFKLITGIE